MSLPPNEQYLAQHILASMQRLRERGLRFRRGTLGFGYVGLDKDCGCALGADWFYFQHEWERDVQKYGPRIFLAYSRRFGVDEWFVEGITVGFDAETNEPGTYAAGLPLCTYPGVSECTPVEIGARDRGRTVGLFLAQWVESEGAWKT